MANRLSLLDLMQQGVGKYNQPVQQYQQPMQQPVQQYQRPVIDPELEQQYTQNIGKPQGFMEKYGLTPGVLTGLASATTALTGGDPYLAGGLAQSGRQMMGQEASAQQSQQARLADYVKGQRREQQEYDKEQRELLQQQELLKLQQNRQQIEKQSPVEALKQLGDVPEGYRLGYDKTGKQILEKQPLGGIESETFQREKQLRTEYVRNIGDFPKIVDSYARVNASVEDPSAAGDLSLIFNYMKMLDPGSVVRESEFANAQNAASIPERIRAQYNKVLEGERLSVKTRGDFADRSNRLYKAAEKQAKSMTEIYKERADLYELDPKRVIIDFGYKGSKPKAITKKKQLPVSQFTEADQDLLTQYYS